MSLYARSRMRRPGGAIAEDAMRQAGNEPYDCFCCGPLVAELGRLGLLGRMPAAATIRRVSYVGLVRASWGSVMTD